MPSLPPIVSALVLSAGVLLAQEPASVPQKLNAQEALVALKRPYLEGKQKLEAEFQKWLPALQTWYLAKLERLQAETAKQANPADALLVKAESDRILGNTNPTREQLAAMPPQLKTLRADYETALQNNVKGCQRREEELRAQCLVGLETLGKQFTIEGDPKLARLVNLEKDALASEKSRIGSAQLASLGGGTAISTSPPTQFQRQPSSDVWTQIPHRPENRSMELRDGWIFRRPDTNPGSMLCGGGIRAGAVRAEFQWPASGNSGSLVLRNKENGYSLSRDRRGVSLRFNNIEVGRFETPNPRTNESFLMELRMSGKFVTAKLDGKEVILVDDELRLDNPDLSVEPSITLLDASVRNIEVLDLLFAGPKFAAKEVSPSVKGKTDTKALESLVRRLEARLLPLPDTKVLMSKTEFTVGEWKLYLQAEGLAPWTSPKEYAQTDEHPLVNIRWDQVKAFCEWLSLKTGKTWRTPRESEFLEAIGKAKYPWGDYFPPHWNDGNYALKADGTMDPSYVGADGIYGTAPVGSFNPNPLGFYDLGGNVQELIWDRQGTGANGESDFIKTMGGCWKDTTEPRMLCTGSYRLMVNSSGSFYVGFRLVKDPR